ncbi:EAL domain-containing protein [Pseudoalteromonas sp. CO302Y]|uniref:EAL domain-containing protein n=1 Tax=unclassified Pseudoalteromonas TaxID=194690 RepID=UPI0010234D44|nr:EAL domain-containing protein [Pseudoalteromonas sp. CO302Y]RZG11262.1 EAL domain-containing protein [Pseudoalteromonas sp. CO133X]
MNQPRRHQKVGDVISQKLVSCPAHTPLVDAVRLMHVHSVTAIFVKHDQSIVGIWTEADCLHVDITSSEFKNVPIHEVMSAPVVSVPSQCLLSDATLRFQQHGIRHLLVMNSEKQPVGMLSLSDIVHNQGLDHYLQFRPIHEQYRTELDIVDANLPIESVVEIMRTSRLESVLVYNPALDIHGIITQRDIVGLIIQTEWLNPCWQYASYPLIEIDSDSSLFDAYRLMSEHNVRHLAVREADICGVISFADLITEIESAYCCELERAIEQRDIALQKSQRNLFLANKIIDASLDGIMLTRKDGTIIQVNPAFTRLTGFEEHEVIGKRPSILSSSSHSRSFYQKMWHAIEYEGVWQGEICNRKKSGEEFVEWLTIIQIKDPNVDEVLYAAIFSDITERKRAEEKISQLAYYDELTGLPNRRLFHDRLSIALSAAKRNQDLLAVMFVDLDRFKEVNDSLGHDAGDNLLQQIAERISSVLPEGDTLARLGGDEFVLLCEVERIEALLGFAEQVLQQVSMPLLINEQVVAITASIGAAVFPDDGIDSATLLKHADIAMYRAKEVGRNSFQLFKPAMNARSLERLAMMSRLQTAIENDEFELYYQPKQHLESGRICGVEALLRWQEPSLGVISPAKFIPLAEELGLIVKLDMWVIEQACKELAIWQRNDIEAGRLAINISANHLRQGQLASNVERLLREYEVDPCKLEVELTESCFISHFSEAKQELLALKKLGVHITLDDFGTGYSALSYLTKLPIDTLKIDASFIAKVPDEYGNSEIVSAIVTLAKSLNIHVVAEGVEKVEQLNYLQALNCDTIQGYYFCRPITKQQWYDFYLNTQK